MDRKIENLQDLQVRIKNIKYGDDGYLDEIVVHGQEALRIIESESFLDEERKITEAVKSAKRMREQDPLMITRKQKEVLWLQLSEGLRRVIEKLK